LQYLAECVSNTSVEVGEISETVLNMEICRLGKILGKQMSKWVQVKRVQLFIMFKRILFFFHNKYEKTATPLIPNGSTYFIGHGSSVMELQVAWQTMVATVKGPEAPRFSTRSSALEIAYVLVCSKQNCLCSILFFLICRII